MPNILLLIASALGPLLWLVPTWMGLGHELSPLLQSLLSGLSIMSAAFLLSWSTELAERDLPGSVALILLALVAVLPEYAVDMTFAWKAGQDPSFLPYALANMTGANRILIGLGWSLLVFVSFFQRREAQLVVHPAQRIELGFLLMATLYSFVLPVKGTLGPIDAAAFLAIFALYARKASRVPSQEHVLVGPSRWLDERSGDRQRRLLVVAMLLWGGFAIWSAAGPFAHGLVELGRTWEIEEFILIQLVAPLASESPEFIVAILFVLHARGSTALGALASSKVNQWTLLVGMLPLVYAASRGQLVGMELDARQTQELLLTSAQSLFAIVVLADLRFSLREAMLLLGLFVGQWVVPDAGARYGFTAIYLLLAMGLGVTSPSRRRALGRLLDTWR